MKFFKNFNASHYALAFSIMLASCAHGEADLLLSSDNYSATNNSENIEQAINDNEAYLKEHEAQLLDLRYASMTIAEYIKLDGNTYTLTISKDQAFKLGINNEVYDTIVGQIKATNDVISEAIKNGDEVDLIDVQERVESYRMPQTNVRNNSLLNASRSTSGGIIYSNKESSATFYVDSGIKKVILKCGTNWAPLVSYTCRVSCFGETKAYTCTGSIYCLRTITAPLSASGGKVTASINFTSTDPQGSFCIWTPSL
ncbi:hypothetical protein [uncultured Duncaniella sp.]|jgi:hypothetical protein|uniref:hypothetical protein n=1 Tax=uncultured Duncaniella sp. TaxID=2768039 RepID=UPI002675FC85|nr:hypothetical protein [uncultured Duncaniella sp.]MCI9172413.1 hypothetical protein [Muribaculaceae bacterium]